MIFVGEKQLGRGLRNRGYTVKKDIIAELTIIHKRKRKRKRVEHAKFLS